MGNFTIREDKMRTKTTVIIVISVMVAIILSFIGLGVWLFPMLTSFDVEESITDVKEYKGREMLVENTDEETRSLFMIFPELEYNSLNIEEYFYEKAVGLFGTTYEVMLSYTLDDVEYEKEVKRISEITLTQNEQTHKVTYTTEGFKYPAYVTVFEPESIYEYALIDEDNNRIICVFSQYTTENIDKINEDYLSINFTADNMLDGVDNIYYFEFEYLGTKNYEKYGE